MQRNNAFYPITSLLRIAERGGDYSEYIRMTVEDALIIREDPNKVTTIHRETYRYAVKLGRSRSFDLDGFRVDKLEPVKIQALLKFFESL